MKKLFCLCLLAFVVAEAQGKQIVSIHILARVADNSISDRDLVIDWLLQNPRSFVKGRREYFSSELQNKLLQENIIQILIEEENRILAAQTLAQRTLDQEMDRLKRAFAGSWEVFLKDFEIAESDVRSRIRRMLLMNQTLETRLRDSFEGIGSDGDEAALEGAENALQAWLQQLRSRYRVQTFNTKEP